MTFRKQKCTLQKMLMLTAFMVVMIFCIGTTAYAASSWETEDNDSRATADSIIVNKGYSGNIKNLGDEDYYKFTTTQAGVVAIKFTHAYVASEDKYWYIELQDAKGEEIKDAYVRGDQVEVTMTSIGLPTGTYYILVDDYNLSETTYNLTAGFKANSMWETEFNETRPTADPISVNTGYSGNIRNLGDEDYYKFTTTQPGVVTVDFTHDFVASEDKYWYIQLQNVDGEAFIDAHIRGDRTAESLTPIGLPAGTYYILVDDYNLSEATYTVKAEFDTSATWETEFNETRPTADQISLNTASYGNIRNMGDEDYFKFSTTKPGAVTVKFLHDAVASENKYWYIELQDVEGNEITSRHVRGDETEVTLTPIGLPEGAYYILVDDYSLSTATYTVNAMFAECHVEVSIPAQEATCTEPGLTEGVMCSVCSEILQAQDVIPAFGHSEVSTNVQPASTTQYGYVEKKCHCGETISATEIGRVTEVRLSSAAYAYNGKVKSPVVIIKDVYGNILKNNVDYTVVKPTGRKAIGKYTYTIKFRGNYAGTIKKAFKINPAKPTIKKPAAAKKAVTVKWNKGKKAQVTGYEVMVATDKKFKKNKKKATVKGYTKVSKKMTGLKAKKTYYVKVRVYKTVKGVKYYSAWSAVKKIKTR